MKAEEILQKARVQLLSQSVFYTTIMLGLEHEITNAVPTAATNGVSIFYNPDFLESLTLEQCTGLLTHEIEHIARMHTLRRNNRDHRKYNMAGDYVINNALDNENIELPPCGLLDHQYDGLSTEKVYSLIPDNPNYEPDVLEPPDDMDQQEVDQRVTELVVKAVVQAEAYDDTDHIPSGLRRKIQKLLRPRINPYELLARYLNEYAQEEYTWSRPNRRYPTQILPTKHSRSIKTLTVAYDTSVSVTRRELQEYLSETENFRRTFDIEKLTLISCDSKIHQIIEVQPNDSLLELELKGGGCTRCEPVLNHCTLPENQPDVLIYFTDLEMSFPKPPPYDVIWINTSANNRKAPFGRVITLKPGNQ